MGAEHGGRAWGQSPRGSAWGRAWGGAWQIAPATLGPISPYLAQAEIAEGSGVALLRYSFVAIIVRLACACFPEEAAVRMITIIYGGWRANHACSP